MVKLVDELGTLYFHVVWLQRVKEVLDAHKEDGVDIANARLVKKVNHAVFDAVRMGYNIVDTQDPERNRFLQLNVERGKMAAESNNWPALYIPPRVTRMAGGGISRDVPIEERIAALPPNSCFQVKDATLAGVYYTVLVAAARPDITLRLGAYTKDVFMFIRDILKPQYYPVGPVHVLQGSNFYTETPDPETFRAFLMDHICIPAEFGEVNLFQGEPEARWSAVLNIAYQRLYQYLHPRVYHIKDFL